MTPSCHRVAASLLLLILAACGRSPTEPSSGGGGGAIEGNITLVGDIITVVVSGAAHSERHILIYNKFISDTSRDPLGLVYDQPNVGNGVYNVNALETRDQHGIPLACLDLQVDVVGP